MLLPAEQRDRDVEYSEAAAASLLEMELQALLSGGRNGALAVPMPKLEAEDAHEADARHKS